ncbi:MAG: hypothetical protein ACXVDD_10995 [Polyangia bacterium]
MRFCPFCAQDNPDDARECVHCGKRLPALRAPSRPAAPVHKPAPPRPAPPRPQPRAPSMAPPTVNSQPHEAFAPTAAPGTLPPLKAHGANGPAKSTPSDATLKPFPDADETHEVLAPPMAGKPAPTRTLLGIPAQEIPGSTHPEAHGDSERRTTKPLSLTDVAKQAKRGPAPDYDEDDDNAQTAVQAPATIVDDMPTSPTPRAEADLEEAPTTARAAPRSRPLDRPTTPGAGVPTRPSVLPVKPGNLKGTAPLPSMPGAAPTRQTQSPSMAPTKPTRLPSGQMPEPLPPPPRVGNDEGAFRSLDVGPTPAIPTLALPPMPEHPKSGSIIDAVKYLTPLAKAIWARKKAQDAIRTLLHGDQRLLDSVLRDLGRVAREEEVNAPAIADEMRRVIAEEERRAAAEAQVTESDTASKKEEERWHFDEGERNAELVRREAELKVVDEDLRKHAEVRRGHDAERAKIDAQIKATEKRAAAADAKAAKAEVTPPEKGGGPNTAANARAEAAEARKEATALIPARDDAKAEVDKLDGPIGELTRKLTDGRATLVQKRRELQEAKATHEKTLAELKTARELASAERDAADRELTQRFVTAGTILNLNRVEHPKLAPLFARVDELKNGVNAREAAIVRLESERRLYDRGAVQKGLLAVGIAAGALILLTIILIVLVKR